MHDALNAFSDRFGFLGRDCCIRTNLEPQFCSLDCLGAVQAGDGEKFWRDAND